MIFHSYVSLPEGMFFQISPSTKKTNSPGAWSSSRTRQNLEQLVTLPSCRCRSCAKSSACSASATGSSWEAVWCHGNCWLSWSSLKFRVQSEGFNSEWELGGGLSSTFLNHITGHINHLNNTGEILWLLPGYPEKPMKNPDANRSSQHEIPNQIVFEWLWK